MTDPGHRVALACSGLGEIRRGYERAFGELYRLIRGDLDVVLFKGGPAGPGVRLLRLSRNSSLAAFVGKLIRRSATNVEVLSFAASLIPATVIGRFDLLHFADFELSSYVRFPKRLIRPNLLFTNGGYFAPKAYAKIDYIHLLSPVAYQQALEYGISKERLFMIPRGVNVERFRPVDAEAKRALRSKYGIPPDAFVVVSVGHLGQASFKRTPWLIDEAAQLGKEIFLLLVGEQDRTSVIHMQHCEERLGDRFNMTTLPPEQMPEAYSVADLFALASLREAFGNVFIEAMSSGLPVVAHDSPVIRWVVGDGGSIIDMKRPGELANEIQFYVDNPALLRERGSRARNLVLERFDYESLKPAYLAMYQSCCEGR
jgi:glycosyltransferase involved in cell wall biosynthesis